MTEPTPLRLEKPLVQQVERRHPPGRRGCCGSRLSLPGLELKARSQWSYARTRFLRHRLAMGGLVGLILHLQRRDLRELHRALPVRRDRPDPCPSGADNSGSSLLRHRRDRPRLPEPDPLGDPDLGGGRRVRRHRVVDHRAHRRGDRRLLRRHPRQPADALHGSRADAAGARDPADRRGAPRRGQPVAHVVHPGVLLLDGHRANRARHLPLAPREGIRRGGESVRRR